MLKWDPVYGPVRVREDQEQLIPLGRQDRAGADLLLAPTMWRQVGQCVVGQSVDTRAAASFGNREHYAGRARIDVLFSDQPAVHREILDALLAGLDTPGERTGWLMTCYETMRDRGRWPVNLPLEQLLADEEVFIQWGEIQPPCPASIQ